MKNKREKIESQNKFSLTSREGRKKETNKCSSQKAANKMVDFKSTI